MHRKGDVACVVARVEVIDLDHGAGGRQSAGLDAAGASLQRDRIAHGYERHAYAGPNIRLQFGACVIRQHTVQGEQRYLHLGAVGERVFAGR